MKASIEYQKALQGIYDDVTRIQNLADRDIKTVLKRIGIAVKAAVVMIVPESDKKFYYYKGQKKDNTHISQDVEYKVKKSRTTKERYVTISGGKKTWSKWHLANDGHVTPSGKFVPGNYFADKAVVKIENEVEDIVTDFCMGLVE